MAEVLSPRGRAVIQTVNFDRIVAGDTATFPILERVLPSGGRITFHREYDLSGLPERVLFRTRLVTPAGEQSAAWPLVPLVRDDLTLALRESGLPEGEEFGDYDRAPFSKSSPALILVGSRHRAEAAGGLKPAGGGGSYRVE